MSSFVHLHTHSDYSLLRSTITIDTLVEEAKNRGMDCIALTDEGNLFGASYFFKTCKKHDVRPIIGCEFAVVAAGIEKRGEHGRKAGYTGCMVLLAENDIGYHNLCMLSSASYQEGFYYFPRVDYKLMRKYSEGLICLSGGTRGEVSRHLSTNSKDTARKTLEVYIDIYGRENTFVEICNHKTTTDEILRADLIELAAETQTELLATNDCYYLDREDAHAHDILLCIGQNKIYREPIFPSEEYYVKTAREMEELFVDIPQAIHNAVRIAERCKASFPFKDPQLPHYTIPESFADSGEYLRHLCYQGIPQRYGEDAKLDEIYKRCDYELETIISMKYTGYFLIVWDVIRFAHSQNIPVGPGRGSGAGSLVAYLLRITNIDPLKYNLLFERFLNPERVSMPDFDIDFCMEERGRIIEYVTKKYGEDHVAQIITFGRMKARGVIRDVARSLDIPLQQVNEIVSKMSNALDSTLKKELEDNESLKTVLKKNKEYKKLFDTALKLEGLHRHASTHPAGLVIAQGNINEHLPLYKDPRSNAISTQFPMNELESCGLIKMDFLGLKTLTIIRKTEEIIRLQEKDFSIENIPEHDPDTYKLLASGDGHAVFQLESSGMQNILRQTKPTSLEDIIAIISLYRPGPIQFIQKYIDAATGKEKVDYIIPELEFILRETYGVIVYQEQVMHIAQLVAGFSLAEADILRRVMGKKLVTQMPKFEEKFLDGAQKLGHARSKALAIFNMLIPFAEYGFNKSHAAAYAILSYQTAYLKTHYPAAFFAANLRCEISFPDKLTEHLEYVRSRQIPLLVPNIQTSTAHFTSDQGKIIFGFTGIKYLTYNASVNIVDVRSQGPFKSILDFLQRVDLQIVTRKITEALILSGCFDCLHKNRASLYAHAEYARKVALTRFAERSSGQSSLFDEDEEEKQLNKNIDHDKSPYSKRELQQYEQEYLGTWLTIHPLAPYKTIWEKYAEKNHLGQLDDIKNGSYTFVGIIRQIRRRQTKKNEELIIAELMDFNGEIDVVFYQKERERFAHLLQNDAAYIVSGKLRRNKYTQIVVNSIKLIEHAMPIHIALKEDVTDDELHELRQCIEERKGHARIILHLPGHETTMRLQVASISTEETLQFLKALPCVDDCWIDKDAAT